MNNEITNNNLQRKFNKKLSRLNVALLRAINLRYSDSTVRAVSSLKSIILAEQRKFHERNNIQKQGNAI